MTALKGVLLSNSQQPCCLDSLRSSCVVFNPLLLWVGSSISSSLGVLGTHPENSLPASAARAQALPLRQVSKGSGYSYSLWDISSKWVQVLRGSQNTDAQRNTQLCGLVLFWFITRLKHLVLVRSLQRVRGSFSLTRGCSWPHHRRESLLSSTATS